MESVTVIVKSFYIEVNPLGESLKGFYGETTTEKELSEYLRENVLQWVGRFLMEYLNVKPKL